MNGTSHFAFGCATSFAVAYIGFKTGDLSLCAAAVSIPAGSMLPDIDHNNTKIGRQRKAMVDTTKKIALFAGLGGCTFTIASNSLGAGVSDWKEFLIYGVLPALWTFVPILISMWLATSEGIKKRFKFFTKHRGIMHTLIPVIGLYVGSVSSKNAFVSAMLLGLAIGYTCHLFADCETTESCPIFWPITEESPHIPLIHVTTGTAAEKLVLALDIGGVLCLAWML